MAIVERASEQGGLATAIQALGNGSVVALPTDTVYGLAVLPSVASAVDRLFALKERPKDVPLPVLVASWPEVDDLAGPLDTAAELLAARFWPGPLTLVVPRRLGFDTDLGGPRSARRTIGVRWPDHPVVDSLCRQLGPLVVTSANLHGSPPATTASEVADVFSGHVGAEAPAVILDGGLCNGLPSTVVECRGPATRCLREGAIPWSEIAEVPRGRSAGSAGSTGSAGSSGQDG
jgi:tRNA threonylcarbamoyl adenosine modification protein (Sua5/YciO/YrdC/YwlC family)